ncbi:MAG TPA: hypothetical protein VGD61_01670 [Pyrinomonadaceae bacterium]
MSDETRELQNFIGRDEKPGWWYLVGVGLSILLAVFCWMQTGLYVRWYVSRFETNSLSYPNLKAKIKADQGYQKTLRPAAETNEPNEKECDPKEPDCKVQYLAFTTKEKDNVRKALNFVLADNELDQTLKAQFETSVRNVKVVVAPIWTRDDPDYLKKNGITLDGEVDVDKSSKSCDIGAATVRDKFGGPQKTADGIPRIVFNPNALADESWTRRVVFHEMMHAMNLPGYYAPFGRAQTDLTYLPEYCWFVGKAKLGSFSEKVCRFFIGFFVATCFLNLFSFVRHRRGESGSVVLSIRP